MDNFTHSLVGALIGQAGLKRRTGLAMPALIAGANLPDVDAACFFWLDGVQHLAFRRGITHGPIAWVVLPLLLAGALWWFDRWQARRGTRPEGRLPVRFGWLYALAFIACLSHPALDWLNSYGIRLLEPFSSRWFYGDTLFIIDVWLWALMGFATWFSLRRERQERDWRKSARVALVVALAYIGTNLLISQRADAQISARFSDGDHGNPVIASPPPVRFWERETIRSSLRWGVDETHFAPEYRIGVWSLFQPFGSERTVPSVACAWPDTANLVTANPDLDAFLVWSRAPFAERAPDGSVLIRDARFYDPRARDRFSVQLPGVKCEPISSTVRAEEARRP